MEFNMHRGSQPTAGHPAMGSDQAPGNDSKTDKSEYKSSPKWLRVLWVAILFGVTFLIIGVAIMLYAGGTKEDNYVKSKQGQAVFLTNGQVYFGKIKAINKQYIELVNVYYLNVSQQVQPKDTDKTNSSVSLVKLGCELHGPQDQMIINRDQVTFWENLKNEGQVAQAITKWVQENPNGQKCATTSTTTNTTNTNTAANKQ
jgi:hypothetical protein